jgi:methylmalonyl-CoA/ethylmalonyl-CoA epimerase
MMRWRKAFRFNQGGRDMAIPEKVGIKQVGHVCVVVKDLQKAMKRYWDIFGIGPWQVIIFQPPFLSNTTVRGKSEAYTMKVAIAQVGNLQWELIQPLTGPSVYKEFLEQKGEGVHHVAFEVEDYDHAVAALKKHGIGIITSGIAKGLGSYAYMDTGKDLGTIAEINKKPAKFEWPMPDSTYPPSA